MISNDTITQVRERADIVAVVSEVVPTLKQRGRSFVGLCPFHSEKTPSFHVNRERGFFHCFGCKESGSVIDFVMRVDGHSFPDTVRSLAERFGIPVEEDTKPRDGFDHAKKAREDLFAVSALAATYFETQLREHEHRDLALEELAKRGLLPGQRAEIDSALQAFRVGYAPDGWDGLARFLRSQGVSPVAAETVGLLVPRNSGTGHYDRFRNRLMFAVLDPQGRVVAFSGRALAPPPGSDTSGESPAKYINSPESPIYIKGSTLFGLFQGRLAIRKEDCAVVVEGNFDVVSLHARGMLNVVAPLGTAFTREQAQLLRRYTANATLFFDGDSAGRKAVLASREPLKQEKIAARVVTVEGGKDPDEIARGPGGIERVRAMVAGAPGIMEYLIEDALNESFHQADANERSARVTRVGKLLAEENDPLVRGMLKSYADRCAGRLDLVRSPDAFRTLERSFKLMVPAPEVAPPKKQRAVIQKPGALERTEMVGAVLDFPELLDEDEVREALGLLEGHGARLLALLGRLRKGHPDAWSEQFLQSCRNEMPREVVDFVHRRMSAPAHETLALARENLLKCANKLKSVILTAEGAESSRETSRAAGNWEEQLRLAKVVQERLAEARGLPTAKKQPEEPATKAANQEVGQTPEERPETAYVPEDAGADYPEYYPGDDADSLPGDEGEDL